jgi:hypothetical protein
MTAETAITARSMVSHVGNVEGCSSIAVRPCPVHLNQVNADEGEVDHNWAVFMAPVMNGPDYSERRRPQSPSRYERYACDEKHCLGPRQYPIVSHVRASIVGLPWYRLPSKS